MKDKKEKQMFSDERTKFIYIDFVVISAILAFISIRGEYVHAILWAVVELIVTPFIVRKGVRLQLMLFTIFTIFAITVAGVSINKMFKTAQASSTAVVSESVSEEMSSMNAELERLKKESEKQSERESVQESLDAYYTAEPRRNAYRDPRRRYRERTRDRNEPAERDTRSNHKRV